MPLKKKKKTKKLKPSRRKAVKKQVKRPVKKVKAKVKARMKAKPKSQPKPKKVKAAGLKAPVIGTITHYFPKVRAAVIKLKMPLAIGATLRIKGHTTDFTQVVNSMQIDHVPVTSAKKGAEIGLLVDSRVRQHDTVYKA